MRIWEQEVLDSKRNEAKKVEKVRKIELKIENQRETKPVIREFPLLIKLRLTDRI